MRIRRIGLVRLALITVAGAFVATAQAAVTFNITYLDPAGVGFNDPALGAVRRSSLETTAALIGSQIGQTASVDIDVAPSQLDGTGFIGLAAQRFFGVAAPAAGLFDGEVYRRIVLGQPKQGTGRDGVMTFDFGYESIITYSGSPPPGNVYMPDLYRHEITHLLGFGSLFRNNGRGRNDTTPDVYSRFDSMLESNGGLTLIDSGGNLLVTEATFMAAYGVGLVFDGPATRAANGGAPLGMYLSDPTHSNNPADVMWPAPAQGFIRDNWSARDIGVLTDLGYQIVPEPASVFILIGSVLAGRSRRAIRPLGRGFRNAPTKAKRR